MTKVHLLQEFKVYFLVCLFVCFFAFIAIFISTKREGNPSNARTLLNQSNQFFKQHLSEYDKEQV